MSRYCTKQPTALVVLFVWSLFVLGCQSTPVDWEEATLTPPERLLAFQSSSPSFPSTLTLIRDKGFIGWPCYIMVYINKQLAARMDGAEKATFYVPGGHTLIKVGPDIQGEGLCWFAEGGSHQIDTHLQVQGKNQYTISWTSRGVLKVSPAEGEN